MDLEPDTEDIEVVESKTKPLNKALLPFTSDLAIGVLGGKGLRLTDTGEGKENNLHIPVGAGRSLTSETDNIKKAIKLIKKGKKWYDLVSFKKYKEIIQQRRYDPNRTYD